ncbi:hypothetical protein [Luteibacter sp. CQ10]|uniref:hypothetical protein n=1 Tax=Luteibacter sp. CQ10 TaxID=2805821 RepID=UPI0034A2A543
MKADMYSEALLLGLRALLSSILEGRTMDIAVLRRVEELRCRIVHSDEAVFFPIRAAVFDLDDIPNEARASLFSEKFLNEQRQKARSTCVTLRSTSEQQPKHAGLPAG